VYEPPAGFGDGLLVERTRYVWDGDTLAHAIRTCAAAEGDPIVEERTYCFEDGSFVPWAHCETRNDRLGVRGSTWAFYVNDPIGTPEELVGADGEVLDELDREAWGSTQAGEEARVSTPIRFQGQHEDAETGLFYNRNRYYDPDAGLYLSPDPLGLEGGLRTFGYGTNPVGWVDPLGLAWKRTEGPVCPLQAYVDDLHSALDHEIKRNRRTTAVVTATDKNGCQHVIVASSEKRLDDEQLALLQPGHIPIEGERKVHAEIKAIQYAKARGWTVNDVVASRGICGPCKAEIDRVGGRALSPLEEGAT
jgi:RHS repeat-associated protein